LAVQKVIKSENLLANIRIQGDYLARLLREHLQAPSAIAAPFTFDIRGGGGFWGIEFDFTCPEAAKLHFKGKFAMLLQERCLANGLIIMGLTGGANLMGTDGNHCIIAPAYNVTSEEINKIVDIFTRSVEEVLKEASV
jgi:adenosylmethionine-8-amino-7-oxononanoate aminotransferase